LLPVVDTSPIAPSWCFVFCRGAVVEAEESHEAKRRARDAALASELDAVLTGAFGRSEFSDDAAAAKRAAAVEAGRGRASASAPSVAGAGRPTRRRFQRVKMTLSVADAQDAGRVQELVQTVMAASRKRHRHDPDVEPAAADADVDADADDADVLSTRREKSGAVGADVLRVPPAKRVTRLDRAPETHAGGANGSQGTVSGPPDAMSDYFRMYDLVCNEQDEGGEGGDRRAGGKEEEKTATAPRKAAGRGLRRGGQALGMPTTDDGGGKGGAGGGVSGGAGDGETRPAEGGFVGAGEATALLCDYMPMVREYLGARAAPAGEGGDFPSDSDTCYVYDVYVQVEDDDPSDDPGEGEGDSGLNDGWRGRDAGDASVIYVGGHDTELFFDAMDGLVDDEHDDDVDSQDSNREDAPCADYPDEEEDETEEEWDDNDGDSDGSRRPRRMEGFYGGGVPRDGYESYDEMEGPAVSGYRPQAGYRETAYDPQYDDVTDDNYYS